MEKFVFIDIHRVLATDNYPLQGMNAKYKFRYTFFPRAIRNLRRLIARTDAKIVLSPSYPSVKIDYVREMWKEQKLPGEIYDVVPSPYSLRNKGRAIAEWIQKTGNRGCSYVIIAAANGIFLPAQSKSLVITNHKRGFTYLNMLKACQILNKPKDRYTFLESMKMDENVFELTEASTLQYLVFYNDSYTDAGKYVFPKGTKFKVSHPKRNDALYLNLISESIDQDHYVAIIQKEKEKMPEFANRLLGISFFITEEEIQTKSLTFLNGSKERLLEIIQFARSNKHK